VKDPTDTLARIVQALEGSRPRAAKFQEVADILREAGGYRRVGLYDVSGRDIAVAALSGAAEPDDVRLRLERGLREAAARGGKSVFVADVAADARSTASSTTRSEVVVPVFGTVDGAACGVIDVESDRPDAFGEEDRACLEHCAAELGAAMSASPG